MDRNAQQSRNRRYHPRRMAHPIVKGSSDEAVMTILQQAAEQGVDHDGVAHQCLCVACQYPEGRSPIGQMVESGFLRQEEVIWCWEPKGYTRGRMGVFPRRRMRGVRLDVSRLVNDGESHILFANMQDEEEKKTFQRWVRRLELRAMEEVLNESDADIPL